MTTHLRTETPTAAKDYKCNWCGERIPKGEKHSKWVGIFEGNFQANRLHDECAAACQDYDDLDEGYEQWGMQRGRPDIR